MKLLQKTSRTYLTFSALLLIVAGILLYASMTVVISEEVNERLFRNIERISSRLERGESVPSLPPDLEIETGLTPRVDSLYSTKATLFDPVQQEEETFLEVTAIRTFDGRTVRITVRQVILEPLDFLGSIGIPLVLVLGLLLLSLVLINRWISKGLWKPFNQNLEQLKSYSLYGDTRIELVQSDISEFEELNRVLESLIARIGNDYRSLKAFTENAAHETQTPVSIIQSRLEEALQSDDLTDAQAGRLESALAAVHRLSRLNRTLGLLARIENRQFTLEPVVLVDVLEKHLTYFEDFIASRELTVEVGIDARPVVNAAPELVESLIGNLISNAVKHNVQGGFLEIVLRENELVFSNSGKDSEVDVQLLFERFRKADPSSPSPGLGLSICRTICEAFGWTIVYETGDSKHTIRVQF